MFEIRCPYCGPRDEPEFKYGGQAHVAYPADPELLSDEEWARFLFVRDNSRGRYAERWNHAAGCRRWFNVIRDTEGVRKLDNGAAGLKLNGQATGVALGVKDFPVLGTVVVVDAATGEVL